MPATLASFSPPASGMPSMMAPASLTAPSMIPPAAQAAVEKVQLASAESKGGTEADSEDKGKPLAAQEKGKDGEGATLTA